MVVPLAIPRRGLFIGGGWREPSLGRRLPVVNHSTRPRRQSLVRLFPPPFGRDAVFWLLQHSIGFGDSPAATAEDIELAVAAARAAFTRDGGSHWSCVPGAVRAKYR
ncbi:hypothetical protein GUJ93_ZPchr0004g39842 [Zizania palustris]|uniref:Uncharacterized protein n=1 Tax=Zizania palustris TaxID=103762 RepID=A0A8J5VYR9_ZIZPA|nr:hypothetical protein GUJ93_ZPchr0004g39842 [Zizania palustris]